MRVRILEVPAAISVYSAVGLGADDLADAEIVGLMNAWL